MKGAEQREISLEPDNEERELKQQAARLEEETVNYEWSYDTFREG